MDTVPEVFADCTFAQYQGTVSIFGNVLLNPGELAVLAPGSFARVVYRESGREQFSDASRPKVHRENRPARNFPAELSLAPQGYVLFVHAIAPYWDADSARYYPVYRWSNTGQSAWLMINDELVCVPRQCLEPVHA
jgi:hypothetical protein